MSEYRVSFRFTVEGECGVGGSIKSKKDAEAFVRSNPEYAAFGTINHNRHVDVEEVEVEEVEEA